MPEVGHNPDTPKLKIKNYVCNDGDRLPQALEPGEGQNPHFLEPMGCRRQGSQRVGPSPDGSKSQNHRMVGVGRDLCGSSSPPLLPKQGHLQQAVEDRVQAGLE